MNRVFEASKGPVTDFLIIPNDIPMEVEKGLEC